MNYFNGNQIHFQGAKQYLPDTELGKLRIQLLKTLNSVRTSQTCCKRKMFRCRKGDQAAQELAQLDLNSNKDPNIQNCANKYGLLDPTKVDFLNVQYTHSAFEQTPTELEAKEGFTKAFEELINTQKSKLTKFDMFTHISLGFRQNGRFGEVFYIVCLLQKKPIAINVIATSTCQQNGPCKIIVGQVLDNTCLPMMVILNKGKLGELKLGTANMVYNQHDKDIDEVKIWFFENQVMSNPFKSVGNQFSEITIDVYMYPAAYIQYNFQYGVGDQNCCLVVPEHHNWTCLYTDKIPGTLQDLSSMSPQEALSEPKLQPKLAVKQQPPAALINRLQGGSRIGTVQRAVQSVQNTVSSLATAKTKTQLLREQRAQEIKNRTQSSSTSHCAIPLAYNGSSFQSPHEQRNNVSFGQPAMNQPFQSKPTGSVSPFTISMAGNASLQPPQSKFQPFSQKQNQLTSFGCQSKQQILPFKPLQIQQPQQQPSAAQPFSFQSFSNQNQSSNQQPLSSSGSGSNKIQFTLKPQNQSFVINPVQPSASNNVSMNNSAIWAQPQQQQQQPPAYNPVQNQPLVFSQPQNIQPQQFQAPVFQQTSFQPVYQVQQPQPVIQNSAPFMVQPQQFVRPQQDVQVVVNHMQDVNPQLLQQFAPQLLSQLDAQQLGMLNQIYWNNQMMFNNLLDKANRQVNQPAQQDPKIDTLVASEDRFCRDVLLATDIGRFITTLQTTSSRIDDSIFQSKLDQARLSYSAALTKGKSFDKSKCSYSLLKDMIFGNQDQPNSDGLQRVYDEYKAVAAHPTERDERRLGSVLKLGKSTFICHSFVLKMASPYFDKLFSANDQRIDKNDLSGAPHRIKLPEWMNEAAFTMFIKFAYLGTLGPRNNSSKRSLPSFDLLLELFLQTLFFKLPQLAGKLVAEGLIPQMNSSNSINVLSSFKRKFQQVFPSKVFDEETTKALNLLENFSRFYVALHLPDQLRQNKSEVVDNLCREVIAQVLQQSFNLISGSDEDNRDLNILVRFAANVTGDGNFISLIKKINIKFEACQAFEFQKVPSMKQFLLTQDPSLDFFCDLVQCSRDESNRVDSKANNNEVLNLMSSHSQSSKQQKERQINLSFNQEQSIDKTFEVPNVKSDKLVDGDDQPYNYPRVNSKKWIPRYNYRQDKHGQPLSDSEALSNSMQKVYSHTISVGSLRQEARSRTNSNGTTFISHSFDRCRRSWHFKLDFDSNENLSTWVVERGVPNGRELFLKNCLTPNFSSVYLLFKIDCPSQRDKQQHLFYSFAHNTNQIIGIKNWVSLDSSLDSEEIEISVSMCELTFHSATMHFLSDNFSALYQRDLKEVQASARKGQILSNTIFHINFETILHLLMSNSLKVEEESAVLGFILEFTHHLGIVYKHSTTQFITKQLVQCLRFHYLDLHPIMSAQRENQWLKSCKDFQKMIATEVNQRLNLEKNHSSFDSITNTWLYEDKSGHEPQNLAQKRKHYDIVKVNNQGRNKKDLSSAAMLEEILKWASVTNTARPDSEHHREFAKTIEQNLKQRTLSELQIASRQALIEREQEEAAKRILEAHRQEDIKKEILLEQLAKEQALKNKATNEVNYQLLCNLQRIPVEQSAVNKSMPKFLLANKENHTAPLKVPETYRQNYVHNSLQNDQNQKLSTDLSQILRQISPIYKREKDQLVLQPIQVNNQSRNPFNPLLVQQQQQNVQPSKPMLTKLPLASQLKDENKPGCFIF